jgi:outer membrane protein assembly factor BamB
LAVACFNAETGASLWRRDVCQAAKLELSKASPSPNLLTLSEGCLYCCSHSGLIACLDGLSGQLVWAVRYDNRGRGNATTDSSPSCPCIVVDGRLFAAPTDSDRLLCLDALTGNSLWSRDKLEAVHLLGVGQGRLVLTTKQGIRWLEAATGLDVQNHPEGGTGPLPSQGRGLLAGDLVFWPTRQGLYVLTQKEGEWPSDLNVYNLLHGRPLGNLALTSKVLAVAGPRELTIYVSPALKRKQVNEKAKVNSKSVKVSEPPA